MPAGFDSSDLSEDETVENKEDIFFHNVWTKVMNDKLAKLQPQYFTKSETKSPGSMFKTKTKLAFMPPTPKWQTLVALHPLLRDLYMSVVGDDPAKYTAAEWPLGHEMAYIVEQMIYEYKRQVPVGSAMFRMAGKTITDWHFLMCSECPGYRVNQRKCILRLFRNASSVKRPTGEKFPSSCCR